jgi:peptidoglycan/LPS O-acetylase OafA/YrhL
VSARPSGRSGAGGSAEKESRVAALTGLRGLAAASVVFYHVWYYGAPGSRGFPAGPLEGVFSRFEVGVTFFFVLSGFLLYRPFARAMISGGAAPRLRDFAIARFLRIVPVYWVMVLVVAALLERHLFVQPWRLIGNLLFLEFSWPGFLPSDLRTDNGSVAIVPSWALLAELGFYLTLPLLALGATWLVRVTRRRVLTTFAPVAALLLVGAGAVAVEHTAGGELQEVWIYNFPMHAGAFACGMAGTTVWVLWERGQIRLPAHWPLLTVLAALVVAVPPLKLAGWGYLTFADARFPIALSFSLLLLLVVLSGDASRVRAALGTRLFVGIGLASYSIFLVHDPLIRTLRNWDVVSVSYGGFLLTSAIIGVATAGLAFASYRLLEKPCFALKRRLTVPTPAPTTPSLRRLVERLVADIDPARVQEVRIDAAPALDCVEPRALRPILTRLLQNAFSYGAAPYVVEGTVADGDLRVVVEDEGRGVDAVFAPRLFEPYARSEPSRLVPGAGLGLSTARQFARARGGDIVYEAPVDGGARFVVTLPFDVSRSSSRFAGSRAPRGGAAQRASPRYVAGSLGTA